MTRERRFNLIIIFSSILLLIIFISLSLTIQRVISNNQSFDPYTEDIRIYEEALQTATAPDVRENLERNLILIKHNATERALGLEYAASRPVDPSVVTPPVNTPADSMPMPTGIVENHGFPYPRVWHINNVWRVPLGEGFVSIYAGARANDPSKGVLITMARADRPSYRYYLFDVREIPGEHGAVRIISDRNYILEIEAEDGYTITLNLSWLKRANSLEDIAKVATAIAPPSYTETPQPPYP